MAKVYMITGASRGLGEAIALQLLEEGNELHCIARTRSDRLEQAALKSGASLSWYQADLGQAANEGGAADELLQQIFRNFDTGAFSGLRLINNAGVLNPIGPAHRNDAADAAAHIAVNLTAPMALTSSFLRFTEALAADKRILQVSSGAGRKPYAGWSVYCAAKAGLDHFTRCVKLEQDALPHGAKVASVAPGVVDTQMQALIRETEDDRFPSRSRFVELHEAGGLLIPHEAASRLLELLEHDRFGEEPVADIRDWVR
ncbi:SDR family NAD(P)-dependent oxidoreductase [Paenibacillus gansuensis]|uniref:SDR family NAD(P)-dependent oxidoreductase n=1 Tax=Paenibacillus gansuensis TaxID=306542 RepID=A0ABW5P8P2_9BACL